VIFIPFQSLTVQFLSSFGLDKSLVFWLSHFYEPIMLILTLVAFIAVLIRKVSNPVIYAASAVLLFGLISLCWSSDIGRSLEGFRFTLLFLAVLLIALAWPFSQEQKDKLSKAFILISLVAALWAIIERFMPSHYWQMAGLEYAFGYGNFMVGNFFRSLSFLGGPNQLGSYLLPAFFLVLINQNKSLFNKHIRRLALFVLFLAICFSMSRAAYVGLFAGLFIYFIVTNIQRWKLLLIMASGLSILLTIFYRIYNLSLTFKDFVLHGESQFLHFTALQNSLEYFRGLDMIDKLLGNGLGIAGPLAVKYGEGLVPESWYIQIILEMGIVGLLLWLALFGLIIFLLIKAKAFGLLYGLISVMIASLFLHTLADNPALSFSLFILIGLALNHTNYEKNTD